MMDHEYHDGTAEDDLLLPCVECGTEFLWTAGEQRFYRARAYVQPRRCARCVVAKKARREALGLDA